MGGLLLVIATTMAGSGAATPSAPVDLSVGWLPCTPGAVVPAPPDGWGAIAAGPPPLVDPGPKAVATPVEAADPVSPAGETADRETPADAAAPAEPSERPAFGSLRVTVEPASAEVWIDGRFVATGAELARMSGPLAVAAGSREVVVTAPGFEPVQRQIEVEPDREVRWRVVLVARD